jgi:hypothetical protein
MSQEPLEKANKKDIAALVPVLLLLAEWHDQYAYRPFVRLLRRPRQIVEPLLGDRGIENSYRILASLFDGDLGPMKAAVLDPRSDEFNRGYCMQGMVLTALAHPQHRPEVEKFIRNFLQICPEAPEELLINWVEAVADLGLGDLRGTVEESMYKNLDLSDYMTFSQFEDKLDDTMQSNGVTPSRRYRKFLITDAVGELS